MGNMQYSKYLDVPYIIHLVNISMTGLTFKQVNVHLLQWKWRKSKSVLLSISPTRKNMPEILALVSHKFAKCIFLPKKACG